VCNCWRRAVFPPRHDTLSLLTYHLQSHESWKCAHRIRRIAPLYSLVVATRLGYRSAAAASSERRAAGQSVRLFLEYTSFEHTPLESERTCECWETLLSCWVVYSEHSDFTGRLLDYWLDCCGPRSSEQWKRNSEYEEAPEVFCFVAEVTVSDDRMIEINACSRKVLRFVNGLVNCGSRNCTRLPSL